jgi:hypothetical protein
LLASPVSQKSSLLYGDGRDGGKGTALLLFTHAPAAVSARVNQEDVMVLSAVVIMFTGLFEPKPRKILKAALR